MVRVSLLLLWALVMAAVVPAQALPPSANAGGTASPAPAPASPYSATVPVAGTSDAQRNAAIAAALAQVLQQVSPGFAASSDALANASGYVRDFHYRRAASGNGLELQVDFDSGAVGRLIAAKPDGGAAVGAPPAVAASTTAPTAAQGGSGTLWVDGIDDSPAFASLLSALRGDGALHDVVPIGATGDGVLLHLGFDQPLTTVLAGLIASNAHLSVDAQPQPGADASLHWTP